MPKQVYAFLPSDVKSTLSPLPGDKIILVNNQEIYICGLAQIQAIVNKASIVYRCLCDKRNASPPFTWCSVSETAWNQVRFF